jgi:hypothetical protein
VYGFSKGAPHVAIYSAAHGQVTGLRSRRRRAEDLGPQRRKAMPPFALFPPLVPLDAASADSPVRPGSRGAVRDYHCRQDTSKMFLTTGPDGVTADSPARWQPFPSEILRREQCR